MNMTNLAQIFDSAVAKSIATNREELPEAAHRRAGIRAVVEALRDEIENGIKHYAWNEEDAHKFFNEILDSDAVGPEKPPTKALIDLMNMPPLVIEVPAADVCEWTESPWLKRYYFTPHGTCKYDGPFCACGKQISFKETP